MLARFRKGIFYEAKRKRYRVRVYKYSRVTHRSYHKTLEAAEAALASALHHRNDVQPPKPKVAAVVCIVNLLGDLVARH